MSCMLLQLNHSKPGANVTLRNFFDLDNDEQQQITEEEKTRKHKSKKKKSKD